MVYLRNFIFDLDGTLIDSTVGIQASFRSAWLSLFPEQPVPNIQNDIGPPIRVILNHFQPTASIVETEIFASNFRQAYDQWGWKMTELIDYSKPFLEMLNHHGCECYGVTNKPSLPTQNILKTTGLVNEFVMFISRDSLDHSFENKAEGIKQIMKTHHLVRENSVMIGDTIEDAEAAFDTGLHFILRKSKKTTMGTYPVLLEFSDYESFEELIKSYIL
jgi:phosphoglycolate phosphatase